MNLLFKASDNHDVNIIFVSQFVNSYDNNVDYIAFAKESFDTSLRQNYNLCISGIIPTFKEYKESNDSLKEYEFIVFDKMQKKTFIEKANLQ